MAIQRATENTVREAPVTGARLQAHDYGGDAYGRALEGFGQQLGKVADVVDEVVMRYDVAAAKNADTEDAIELAKIRATALTAVGEDAPKAHEEATKAADQLKRNRLTTLKGRRAELYSQSFDQRLAGFEGQLTEHSIKQSDVAARGSALARADASVDMAVDGFADPNVWDTNMATAKKEFYVANKGLGQDALDLKWKEATSKAHVKVVASIMTLEPDNPLKAEKWIEDHAAEITPADEPALRKSLQPLIDDQQADSDFARSQALGSDFANATLPEGEDNHDLPSASVPVPGKPQPDLQSHLVGGKGTITNTAAQHQARGSKAALDIAAPEGTAIRPPMSGRVIKSWLDLDHGGGWSLLVQHPNGMVTGYAHMKSKSPLEVGAEVESTTIVGSVGSTGKSTGPHLHFTVRDAKGTKVDPQTVDFAAVAGSGGKTVDPQKVSWKEGQLIVATADKNTLGEMIDNITFLATKENWSQRRYDRAVAKAKELSSANDQLYRQQYDDFKDGVWAKIASLDGGDGLTSITQLGGDYGRLEGTDQLTVQNLIQTNKRRLTEGTSVKAYGPEYSEWALMASGTSEERDLFLRQDFRIDPNMTAAERFRLTERQQQLRADADGRLAADTDRIRGVVNRYSQAAQFNPTEASKPGQVGSTKPNEHNRRQALLVDRVNMRVQQRQKELNRPLNDLELEEIVRGQVISVHRGDETMPLYLSREKPNDGAVDTINTVDVYNQIPQGTRDSIIRALQANGIRPTPYTVVQTYVREARQ